MLWILHDTLLCFVLYALYSMWLVPIQLELNVVTAQLNFNSSCEWPHNGSDHPPVLLLCSWPTNQMLHKYRCSYLFSFLYYVPNCFLGPHYHPISLPIWCPNCHCLLPFLNHFDSSKIKIHISIEQRRYLCLLL